MALPPVVWWGVMPRRELLVRTGLATLAAVLAIAPWTVRNAFVVDAFVPVSTNSAQTFWAGHNPTANGGATYARGEIFAELQDLPPERFEVEQSRLLRREALEYMFENPKRELTLIPRKLLYLSIGDSRAIQTGSTLSQRASQGAPVTGGDHAGRRAHLERRGAARGGRRHRLVRAARAVRARARACSGRSCGGTRSGARESR